MRRPRRAPFIDIMIGNSIGMHGAVMYRRAPLVDVGGFDEVLRTVEDWDMYLRLAKEHSVAWHDGIVANYRRHGNIVIGDYDGTLRGGLTMLEHFRPSPGEAPALVRAWSLGRARFVGRNMRKAPLAGLSGLRRGRVRPLLRAIRTVVRYTWFFATLDASGICGPRGSPASIADETGPGERIDMAGRLRRLLRTVPRGRVDLGQVATLAAQTRRPGAEVLTPSAALARNLLAERLEGADPQRCCVVGAGRLVSRATLPFDCRMTALSDVDHDAGADLGWLVVGDALAAEDDPPALLTRLANHFKTWPGLRMLVVLPGTALLPDDDQRCPRRWLFSRVSGETMARTALEGRALTVSTLGNVLAASADLLGFASDRLWSEELVANDPEYPMVVAIDTTA